MKKIIGSLILVSALIFSIIPYSVFAEGNTSDSAVETKKKDKDKEKYDILYKLGILKDAFAENDKLTRGETAAAAIALSGYSPVDSDSGFSDVSGDNPYRKEIAAAKRLGLMIGKGNNIFAPDDAVTYEELKTVIIRAAGYDKIKNMDWVSMQAEAALENGNSFSLTGSDVVSIDAAGAIFFAALDIPYFEVDAYGNIVKTDDVLLNVVFDVYKTHGVLNAAKGTTTEGRKELSEKELIITDSHGEDYIYYDNDTDYTEFMGCDVNYYYQTSEDDDAGTIISMYVRNKSKKALELSFDEILNAANDLTSLRYEKDGVTRTILISPKADYIYNGRNCYGITAADLMPDNGYITLVDSNNDNVYDVIQIKHYEYIMAAQINADNQSVLDEFTWKTFDFKADSVAEEVRITRNGRDIKLAYVAAGEIISIMKSRDGKKLTAEVSDGRLAGKLQFVDKEEHVIQVADQTVKCIKSFNFDGLSMNAIVTIGLDVNGYAVGYVGAFEEPDISFGYLYNVFKSDEGSDDIAVKLLNSSDEFKTYKLSDRFRMNDYKYKYDELISHMSDEEGSLKPQLVAYILNSDGEISKLYSAGNEQGVVENQEKPLVLNKYFTEGAADKVTAVYNNFGMTLDFEYNMPDSAVMFDITFKNGKVDKKNSHVKKIQDRAIVASTTPENLYIYNADMACISRLCVYEHSPKPNSEYNENFSTQAFLVSSVSRIWDEDEGETVTVYKGYHAGKAVEFRFSEELQNTEDLSKIQNGDVLLVWLSGNEIMKFRRLYTEHEENAFIGRTDRECSYGDHKYTGETVVREGDNWDYPFDWAQHIFERVESQSGSTTPAATRWLSLYGQAELVYKASEYNYPVIKMTPAGKAQASAYTMDANTYVYVYHRNRATVEVLDPSNTNFSYDKAVVCARYGNVRDVIAYED